MSKLAIMCTDTSLRARTVCRAWRHAYDERVAMRFPEATAIFTKILRGGARNLSFEYCHRTIYTACIRRRCGHVILALRAVCVELGPRLAWYDRIRYARLIADVCLFMTRCVGALDTARFALSAMAARPRRKRKRGRLDSNQRSADLQSAALPLGHYPNSRD